MNNDWNWMAILSTERPEPVPFVSRNRKSPAVAPGPNLPQVTVSLRQWDGPVGPWKEHFGKYSKQAFPMIGSEPKPSCMEVEVVKLLRDAHDHAFWVSCFDADKLPARW